jgi:predicted permease
MLGYSHAEFLGKNNGKWVSPRGMPVNTPAAVLNSFIIPVSLPALTLLYVPLLGAHGQAIQITVYDSAMPPMITAAILATEHDLDPPLATPMVAVGLVISFDTLTGWWWLMRGV